MFKRKYILLSLFLIGLFIIWYFNISFTSIPTTFSDVFKNNLTNEEELEQEITIGIRKTSIVTEDLKAIAPDEKYTITLDDPDQVFKILNSDLRIYNGGRIEDGGKSHSFLLFISFEDGHELYYKIAKEYITITTPTSTDIYKTLDDDNKLYDYLQSLYDE